MPPIQTIATLPASNESWEISALPEGEFLFRNPSHKPRVLASNRIHIADDCDVMVAYADIMKSLGV